MAPPHPRLLPPTKSRLPLDYFSVLCQSRWATLAPRPRAYILPGRSLLLARSRGCGRMDPALASGFSQEQFREACAELQQPALAGAEWQLMMETLGISIYRLLDQVAACLLQDPGLPRARASLPWGTRGCSRGSPDRAGLLGAGRSERRGGASS